LGLFQNYLPQQEEGTETMVEFDELMEAIEAGMDHLPDK